MPSIELSDCRTNTSEKELSYLTNPELFCGDWEKSRWTTANSAGLRAQVWTKNIQEAGVLATQPRLSVTNKE